MRPYDEYDAQHDIETIENGGEWGTAIVAMAQLRKM